MMAAGTEPELRLGDSGQRVIQLQTRLQLLGLFDGSVDGAFGEQTTVAVTQLQAAGGVQASGEMDALTWGVLAQAEKKAGLRNPAAELTDPVSADVTPPPVGTVSEDQHWRWDGEQWQPNEERADLAGTDPDEQGGGQLSADGQWLWDGARWQPADT
jgi:peptidoglycan hydrolase-like protein with peptidoglycan-binding domain